jgi:hypothetical protein
MDKILAERHNNLYERIVNILGNGAGRNGYGQGQGSGYGPAPESFPVSKLDTAENNLITAETINSMYADIIRARIHQIGTVPQEIAEIVANANIIAEETSYFVNTDPSGSVIEIQDADGTKKGFLDFERLVTNIESDKFLIDPAQAVLEPAISSSRVRPWNGLIFHEIAVTFRSADHRRHFFNSGGQIRFSLSNSGSTTAKGQDWGLLCANLGTVIFSIDSTIASAIGVTNSIGNYDLTDTYQTILNYVGGGKLTGIYFGVYSSNLVTFKAKSASSNVINFRIEFNDLAGEGTLYDQNVTGRLESVVQQYRAESNAVAVPAPLFSNVTDIS